MGARSRAQCGARRWGAALSVWLAGLTASPASAQLCDERVNDAAGILAAPRCENLGASLGGAMDGEHTDWYPNGQAHYRLVYRDGARNGPSTGWYADGTIAMQGSYRDDRRHGPWTLFDPQGRKTDAGAYDNGRPSGVWKRWRQGESLAAVTFADGVAVDLCPRGTAVQVIGHDALWERRNGAPAPRDRNWGTIAYCTTEDGVRQGPLVDRAADGRLRIRGAYHDGARHGPWRVWRGPDVWEDELWVDGKRHGEWQSWRHGVRVGEYHYDHDVRAGRQREWFDNGQLAFDTHYVAGEPHGPVESWHENGQRALRGAFVHGVRDGVWVAWSPTGMMRRRGMYRDGGRVGAWGYWYDNGNLYLSGRYEAGTKHGLWRYWHRDGRLGQEGRCEHGAGVGTWREWDEHGALARAALYSQLVADAWEAFTPCADMPLIESVGEGTPWAF